MTGAGASPRPALLALLVALLLSGCGWVRVPVQSPPATAAGAAGEGQAAEAGTVVVQRGDTLYAIARQHGVPVRGLIRLNDLRPPYQLEVGDVLRLPPPSAVHTVAPGESLYGISRRYGVDMARLARENDLDPGRPIVPGQKLIVPESIATVAAAQAALAATAAPVQLGAPPPSSMAVESEPLPPLPVPSQSPAAGEAPAPLDRPAQATPAAPSEQAAVAPPRPATPTRGGRRGFLRPVDGPILSSYGPKSGGLHNDGINIGAARGTPVRAAQDGVVAYAGNELPGFGNLVLVKHDDGWITAYGHNEEILVAKGQAVKRGQPIARVGSSGNVSQPQVHFELRQGSRAIDPTPYLSDEGQAGPKALSADDRRQG